MLLTNLINNIKSYYYYPVFETNYKKISLDLKDFYIIKKINGENIKIHGWLYINKSHKYHNINKPFIIFCHGNGGNVSCYQYFYKYFMELGYSFITFDYKGYGKSTGKTEIHSTYEDCEIVYNYVINKLKIIKNNIIPVGYSIGGYPATILANKKKLNKLVLIDTFTKISNVIDKLFPYPINKLLSYIADNDLNIIDNLKLFEGKTFIIHSTEDEVIHVNNAFDNAKNNKNIKISLITGTHNNLNLDWNIFNNFLKPQNIF